MWFDMWWYQFSTQNRLFHFLTIVLIAVYYEFKWELLATGLAPICTVTNFHHIHSRRKLASQNTSCSPPHPAAELLN